MKFAYTQTIETSFTLDDIIEFTTAAKIQHGKNVHLNKTHQCLSIISNFIKENRFELLGTFAEYRIITNGYAEFKRVELDNIERNPKYIFNAMKASCLPTPNGVINTINGEIQTTPVDPALFNS